MPRPTLDAIEVRVVGALVEKALATPDSYPLSLNALVGACNQKTARDPVVDYSEREVTAALDRLGRRGLVGTTSGAGHRVAKFRQNLDRALGLSRRELAALAVLLLRGPQTAGEVRTRAGRMADFESTEAAEEALWMLGDRNEPLAVRLDRAPGQSADRYAHALSGEPQADEPQADEPGAAPPSASTTPPAGGAGDLEERVAALEAELARLREAFAAFRSQFE
ncbi:DUF480 domain-containing protein [Rubrivirga sp. S365]|uniref:YceH family protein n=1 Tax=Rubrivirga sp. S365 TaxID=3076080 RepID=UPI0028C951CB|nr:DUF480 domain-containing protein [Rubrivirga sp. S365]MDT7857433.1 DUF480 domain-containing protein [Rubrivirga sp. S365]